MREIIFLTTCLWSLTGTAGQAIFCLELHHFNARNDSLGVARCTVTQFLTEPNLESIFECEFNGLVKQNLNTHATRVGFDRQKQQEYSTHEISPMKHLGRMLLSGLGLEDIVDGHELTIFYGNKRPRSTKQSLSFTNFNGRTSRIEINSLEYGVCMKE